jgi:hypothetical protein
MSPNDFAEAQVHIGSQIEIDADYPGPGSRADATRATDRGRTRLEKTTAAMAGVAGATVSLSE